MKEPRCEDCGYWQVITAGGSWMGECRRHAPIRDIQRVTGHQSTLITNYHMDEYARFPTTRREDWCGDFVHASSLLDHMTRSR